MIDIDEIRLLVALSESKFVSLLVSAFTTNSLSERKNVETGACTTVRSYGSVGTR